MNISNIFGKYTKDWFIVLAVVTLGLLAVSADGFSDLAHKPFWWKFWEVVGVLSLVAWVAGWVYLKSKDNAQSKGK